MAISNFKAANPLKVRSYFWHNVRAIYLSTSRSWLSSFWFMLRLHFNPRSLSLGPWLRQRWLIRPRPVSAFKACQCGCGGNQSVYGCLNS